MKKFIEFLMKLFFNKSKEVEPSVYEMSYISSELKNDKEIVTHGKGKYWVKIEIEKDLEKKEGKGSITSNLKKELTEEEIIYLLKRYL